MARFPFFPTNLSPGSPAAADECNPPRILKVSPRCYDRIVPDLVMDVSRQRKRTLSGQHKFLEKTDCVHKAVDNLQLEESVY